MDIEIRYSVQATTPYKYGGQSLIPFFLEFVDIWSIYILASFCLWYSVRDGGGGKSAEREKEKEEKVTDRHKSSLL